jgi:hypothetical protein
MTAVHTPTTTADARPRWSTKNKVGLALTGVYALGNLPSVFEAAPDGEVGPPLSIMVVCSIFSLVGLVAVVVAWRSGSRVAARLAAASIVVITLTSLPAFFVDVPAFVKALVAVSVIWTVGAVVLTLSPSPTTPAA